MSLPWDPDEEARAHAFRQRELNIRLQRTDAQRALMGSPAARQQLAEDFASVTLWLRERRMPDTNTEEQRRIDGEDGELL